MSGPPVTKLPPRAKLGLLLLVALPCVPGLVFLLAGLLTDPHRQTRDASPAGQAEYARTWARTRSLYLVGAVVLMAGNLGAAAVIWKIVRPGPSYEEEKVGKSL